MDVEILVLRHQVAVLRRQVARPRLMWAYRRRPRYHRIGSLVALMPSERTKLGEWFPHLHATFRDGQLETAPKVIAISSPLND